MRVIGNVFDITAELNLIKSAEARRAANLVLSGKKDKRAKFSDNLFIHPALERSPEFQQAIHAQHKLVEENRIFDAKVNMKRILNSLEKAVAGEKVKLVKLGE